MVFTMHRAGEEMVFTDSHEEHEEWDPNALFCTFVYLWPEKQPRREVRYSGAQWVRDTLSHAGQCHNMFGMTPHQFQLLHNILVHRYGLQGGNVVTTEEAVGIFMWTVRGSESNRQAQNKFPHSGSTISLYFWRVLNRVYNLGVDNIRSRDPTFQGVHPRMTCPQFFPWFDG